MLLTITFKLGTDLDIAQVQVQNRVRDREPVLPFDVQHAGIVVKKARQISRWESRFIHR